jgi:VIT1/CCC1 family predicted Fe2+/Mn2+ transporter
MSMTPHIESHFTATDVVRDIVIGMSDGLTVPFALAAGISGAGASTAIVVTAGMAEIAAGSIAMGLGGYLAARTDAEHYATERARETAETQSVPERERAEVAEIFRDYGLPEKDVNAIVKTLSANKDFMMRFELGLELPNPARARQSALTIAISYIAGGFVPLAPYIFVKNLSQALYISIVLTLIALFVFGFAKGRFTGLNPLKSGGQTILIGGLAAAVAFLLARLLG